MVQAAVFFKRPSELHIERCFLVRLHDSTWFINHCYRAVAVSSAVWSQHCLLAPHEAPETVLPNTGRSSREHHVVRFVKCSLYKIKTWWSMIQISKFCRKINFPCKSKALFLPASININNHGHWLFAHWWVNFSCSFLICIDIDFGWQPVLT